MARKNIEVEVRSFISKKKYSNLLKFFRKNGKFLGSDKQITYYYRGLWDLRIQKNNFFSKIWLKKGRIHDDFREELEIKFARNDFGKLEKLFKILGLKIEIKWVRIRNAFRWQGIDVAVDFTKGYGYIVELEKLVKEQERKKALELLKKKLKFIGVSETPKKIFERKFKYYKKNWKNLIR